MNLESLGYANHYYSAAIKSMLQSWHNFFFVAAEPGASVSVDKPPLGLWLQAVSAYFLGVNSFAMILPEIIAGILSEIVLYRLVQRWFGTAAGLLAGLMLYLGGFMGNDNVIDAEGLAQLVADGKLRFI